MPSRPEPRATNRPLVAPLVLGLLPFVLFASITTGSQVFSAQDVQAYFFPYHVVPARLLRDGSLPLWNPYAFSGIPLLGDGQTAMFYPPNWLFLVLPGAFALNYAVLLQFSLAGVSTYLFARALGLWRLPAFVAGLAFMFCGFLTARVVHLSIMSGAAMIPLVLFCLDRLLASLTSPGGGRRPGARWLALTGLAIAAQVAAGHPQMPVYTALAAALYTLVRGIEQVVARRSWRPLVTASLALAAAYVLGYAFAAIQLVPWAEAGRLSVRAAGADFGFVFGTSTTGAEWLLFLFPYLLGAHGGSLFRSGEWDINTAVRVWEHSGYVGVLPLALALVAAWHLVELTRRAPRPADGASQTDGARRLPGRWYSLVFLVLLLATGLILAAGWHTPASQIVYRIPVLGSLRAVERGLVLASFALTVLAGFGLQRVLEGPQPLPWLRLPAVVVGVVTAFFVWQALGPGRRALSGMNPADLEQLSLERPQTYVPLLLALASGLLLAWWSWRPGGLATKTVVVAVVLLDLGLYAVSFNPTAPRALYTYRPPVMQVLPTGGEPFRKATLLVETNDVGHRMAREILALSWGMVYGVEDVNGFNSLQPRRYTDYLFGPQVGDVSYGYLRDLSLLRPDSPILSSLNVRYLLAPADLRIEPGPHLRPVFGNGRVHVWENTRAYPRAYFPERVRNEMDAQAVLREVTAPGFDGRRDAVVETPDPPAVQPSTTPAEARVRRVAPTDLRIATSTTEPRLLVVSEMYYPGWRAYVDGVETPILRTNYLFRGVVVPAGRHVVRFAYLPSSVLTGAAVSSLALLLAGVLLHRSRQPPRRRGELTGST
jgi:hypothetical protein